MKKLLKSVLSIALALAIVFSSAVVGLSEIDLGVNVSAALGGTTGECTWSLDGTVLTISGNGVMSDYEHSDAAPWGTDITKAIIENGVENIGEQAFYKCNSLTEVSIADTVEVIENHAFQYCDAITSVFIPESVNVVGALSFHYCASLQEINVDENNLFYSSDDGVLFNKNKTELVKYPDGKTDIEYEIPDGVQEIGLFAFDGCIYFARITIPESLRESYSLMNLNVFDDCIALEEINVAPENPDFCSVDGVWFNKDKTKLISYPQAKKGDQYSIPDTVTEIGTSAFYKCENIMLFTIPESVECINNGAFRQTGYYQNKSNWENGALYIGDCLIDCDYTLPEEYVVKPGTRLIGAFALSSRRLTSLILNDGLEFINSYAFDSCQNLTTLTIPGSVKVINGYFVKNCANLTEVIISDGVECINSYAFNSCENLTTLTIPGSVKVVSAHIVNNCEKFTAVTICDGVEIIEADAFYGCNALSSISLPDSIKYIGAGAFNYTAYYNTSKNWVKGVLYINNHLIATKNLSGACVVKEGTKTIAENAFYISGIKSVTLPDGLVTLAKQCFYTCPNLESINLPDSIEVIDDNALANNIYLHITDLPANLEYIGKSAFVNATAESITIPDGVKFIGDGAFSLSHLTEIKCENNPYFTSVDGVLFDKGLTELIQFPEEKESEHYVIPSSVNKIRSLAFYGCSKIKSVVIPEGLTTIGVYAFGFCYKLESIVVPRSVKTVEGNAFWAASQLEYVFYAGTEAEWKNIENLGEFNEPFFKAKIHYEATDHTLEDWEMVRPSCDEEGYNCRRCVVCKDIVVKEPIPATGHTSGDWIYDGGNSCTATGERYKKCTVCGTVVETEEYQGPGHTETDWIIDRIATCTASGSKHKECTTCGEITETVVITATGHVSSEWIIDKNSTCTASGSRHKECTVCGATTEASSIPATGHTPSDWIVNVETRTRYKECVNCKEILERENLPLIAPVITSCYNEVDGVQLKWSAVTGAKSYTIYRKLPAEMSWEQIATVSDVAYRDIKVSGNTVYQYKINAVDQYGGVGEYSAQRECRFIETPALLTRENAVGGVKITWEKVEGATSYRIYRRGAGTDYWFYLGDFDASLNTFTDLETANYFPEDANKNTLAKPKSGNYYRYTVRASYDGEDSNGNPYLIYSGFDTVGLYLKYVATPKLTSISNATNGLQIKWNAVNGGGDIEYRVYRRGAGSTYWYYLGTTTNTTWTDEGVKSANGGYYRYTVRAVAGKNGNGWYSAFDTTGLYLMRLSNPTLTSAVSSSSGITVKWESVKGATSYYV